MDGWMYAWYIAKLDLVAKNAPNPNPFVCPEQRNPIIPNHR